MNENHDFQVSGAPISFEDLVGAYYKLLMVLHLMIALSTKKVISGSADIFSINILEKIIW